MPGTSAANAARPRRRAPARRPTRRKAGSAAPAHAAAGPADAARALRESEARFDSVFRHSPVGIAIIRESDRRLVDVNASFARMTGASVERLVGLPASDVGLAFEGRGGSKAGARRRFRRLNGETGELWVATDRITLEGRPHQLALVVDVTQRRRVEMQLETSQQALRRLAAQLRSAREEERTRLARTVHDELGHAFTDLKLDLAWIDRRLQEAGLRAGRGTRQRVASMMRRVEEHLGTVRQIATDLRPALLDSVGLGPALVAEAREFERRTRIACRFALPDPFPAIDPGRSTALFRIFQEVLANVARHAFAARVEVRLGVGDGRIVLEVSDDGRGIGAAAASDRQAIGLLGMRERAFEFGGDVAIRGVPGRGTVVRVWLPWESSGSPPSP